jgi:hypothetical protein
MKQGLTAAGKVVYGIVMTFGAIADIAITILLFASGHVGWGLLYVVIGWTITLTIVHWIGLLLASPFLIAGDRSTPTLKQGAAQGSSKPQAQSPKLSNKRGRWVAAAMVVAILGVLIVPSLLRRFGTSSLNTTTVPVPIATTVPVGTGSAPSPPFTVGLTGSQSTSSPNSQGQVQVVLSMHLQNAAATPLTVTLIGSAAKGGGIAMSSGRATLGSSGGVVTSVSGGTVTADLSAPTPMTLTLALQVDQNSGALSGTASGTAGPTDGHGYAQ